jgi:hypothetical protein
LKYPSITCIRLEYKNTQIRIRKTSICTSRIWYPTDIPDPFSCWNWTADTLCVRRGRPHTRRAHPGCRAVTHASARIAAGFRSLGPTRPQKASLLGGYALNLINHAFPPSPHNVGLFPTISPSHIVSQDLFENALGQPGSDTNCWNRSADTWHVRQGRLHTRRAHRGCRAVTHVPARIAACFRSLGPTLPQKASLSGVYALNLINHAFPPSPHNVGLFPTISPHTL